MRYLLHGMIAAACLLAAPPVTAQVTFRPGDERIEILVDGRPFSNFYYGKEWSQPFLHPLRTVSGVSVTRGYPLEKVEGESQDHIWHHGLWYSHGDMNGIDFWRDLGPDKTGRMVLRGEVKTGNNRLSADFDLIGPEPEKKRIGRVTEEFGFARRGEANVVDLRVTIHADAGTSIKMGDTEEGSLGIRFDDAFREDRGAVLTNSDGLVGSRNIWGKRAKWVDYTTQLKSERVGVLILDHPTNPKYPTFWHARNYGLNAANPFGESDFMRDNTRDGSRTIAEGGAMTFRYRLVIHLGGVEQVDPEKWSAEFSAE